MSVSGAIEGILRAIRRPVQSASRPLHDRTGAAPCARGRVAARIARYGAPTVALAAILLAALPSRPEAHEIPPRVTIFAFVKPDGDRLTFLVRVPLESIRDVEFPLRSPGEALELARVDPFLRDAAELWIRNYVRFFEGGRELREGAVVATRISLPSDLSFSSYELAQAHLRGAPLDSAIDLPWKQALLDVLLEYPITSSGSDFSIDPALAHLGVRTITVLRFLPPGEGERLFQYVGNPGLVRLDPRWHQAAYRFVALGFAHILDGLDHLLFVFCLVIPFRKPRPLIVIVTSFTVAHSVTLIASAYGLAPDSLWFPPLIETLIALSIVYMAFENIVGARLQRRWIIAFAFGLVHGFGFSFLLRDSLQFAGTHLVTSLLAFNVGVEIGQLLVLAVSIPLLALLFRHVLAERLGTIILSALVAHTAWHWMTERASLLREYDFQFPAMDAALLASAMRWLMLLLILVGMGWVMRGVYKKVLGRGGGAGVV